MMSDDWRRKGLTLLPDLEDVFRDKENTPYLALSAVKDHAIQALKYNQQDIAKRCFDYAEWCHHSNDKDTWNAAGVCFYEYVFGEDALEPAVTKLVSESIFSDISELLTRTYSKRSPQKLARLKAIYDSENEGSDQGGFKAK